MRAAPIALVALAVVCAWLFGMSRLATAALVGIAGAIGLIIAGRRVTLRFAALSFGAALAFGIVAMVLAELTGQSVRTLLEAPLDRNAIALVLAWLAVMFAALGFAGGLWAMLRGAGEDAPTDAP